MQILLIEDQPMLVACVQEGLDGLGWRVDLARDGVEGRFLATEGDYALVLLDVALAGADLAALQAIRRTKQMPVLMLTARDKLADRLRGLQLGADDYLAMPFSAASVRVRVQALLQRRTPPPSTRVQLADLQVDLQRRECARNRVLLKLSPKEFDLLAELLQHPGKVVSHATLAQRVWNTRFEDDCSTLEVTVGRLRKKLDGPFDVKLLHTVRGAGYVLEDREAASGALGAS
jgi:two-component system copper resistance phosphate regulon response regulator CusR